MTSCDKMFSGIIIINPEVVSTIYSASYPVDMIVLMGYGLILTRNILWDDSVVISPLISLVPFMVNQYLEHLAIDNYQFRHYRQDIEKSSVYEHTTL